MSHDKWIPISKEIPPEDTEVFVTTAEGKVRLCTLWNDEWTDCCVVHYIYSFDRVVAWMPIQIPKPYEDEK